MTVLLLLAGFVLLIAPLAVSNQLVRLNVPLMVGLSGLVGGSRLTVASDGATGSFWSWASSPTPSAVAFIFVGEIALALGEAGALLVHERKNKRRSREDERAETGHETGAKGCVDLWPQGFAYISVLINIRLCLKSQRARRARGRELCSKAFEADVAAATAMQNNAAAEIIRPRAVREEFSNRA